MLSFLKRKKTSEMKNTGNESITSAKDLLNEETDQSNIDEEIYTDLSIHPDWNVQQEQFYVFKFLNNECTPLKPNQISLNGIELEKYENQLVATVFVRNSLAKAIRLEEASIVFISQNEIIGRKKFTLHDLGEVPARSSRPWMFVFDQEDLFKPIPDISNEEWSVAFEIKQPNRNQTLELADSWEKTLAEEDKEKLKEMFKTIQHPKPGEVQFVGIQAKMIDDGKLFVTLLVQNGSQKNIKIEQLPLVVEDANGVIAKGGFVLDDFEIKSHTSKPWNFIFPSSLLTKDRNEIDLSNWKVYPPQN